MLKYYDWFLMGKLAGYDVFAGPLRLGTIKPHKEGGWTFYGRNNPDIPTTNSYDTLVEVKEVVEEQWELINDA